MTVAQLIEALQALPAAQQTAEVVVNVFVIDPDETESDSVTGVVYEYGEVRLIHDGDGE